ncbi:hypothetical protein [Streptomyces virginiae]|uniref:hypothetical protein n=1 Tax=Streptomyces virginiae TaxID=1961 RepID=UPI00225A60D8|nr:hypothetical protein [Streptomyces virginiae]MCX5181099.1 hypothetical protein [Streptomyces virginiae]
MTGYTAEGRLQACREWPAELLGNRHEETVDERAFGGVSGVVGTATSAGRGWWAAGAVVEGWWDGPIGLMAVITDR